MWLLPHVTVILIDLANGPKWSYILNISIDRDELCVRDSRCMNIIVCGTLILLCS
jgi:hypothetical protein